MDKPIYVCRSCGTTWVRDGKTIRPIWSLRARNCKGRIEPAPAGTKENGNG